MKLQTKLFWNSLPLWITYLTLKTKASRNIKMPEYYTKTERNKICQTKFAKILKYFGITLKVEGFDNVPNSPCLIVPNHSTYFDALIMTVALSNLGNGEKVSKRVNFIAKSEVARKKSIQKIAQLLDTYYLDFSKPRELLSVLFEFGNAVKANKTCGVVFAEGTRSRDGKLGEFQTGAFKLAQSCYLPIVPVTINNAANALDMKRDSKLEIEVIFHPQIKPITFQTIASRDLADQVKNIIASRYVDQTITSKETIKNTYSKKKVNK
ncbi:1-acyl-sn-glycerol-3-phosphate acyltransferase [Metamycoplasma arthritidis]|uniref:1-acyl-sn-glycerol-3-phosphate acyltransferase n=1 Tax=Metamycoplasma arthritidis (strain 158L3-1) TaxID=243272 RepID=B3PLS4_META1|nr:lysophospholipid acyltransferase family protein [Metamycoplasma arthritidis]ACF06976.1 1-acyl-sn-glycerol-3-phosphate acyltransferase [Metamycoplasma arthritidis 158L3-1]VEU78505.1 1-acyl-sn-glycerol-3-phosphate acyltransferase [Metamycoplasma arthritidis]